MNKTSKPGGERPGAGRKPKWDFWFKFKIGQECEILFRDAAKRRLADEEQKLLSERSNLSQELNRAQAVDVGNRSEWLQEEDGGDQYLYDIEGEIEQLNKSCKNENLENRLFFLPARPMRGTRKAIIKQIAAKYSLTKNQVDNLWQAYRRFEKSK